MSKSVRAELARGNKSNGELKMEKERYSETKERKCKDEKKEQINMLITKRKKGTFLLNGMGCQEKIPKLES